MREAEFHSKKCDVMLVVGSTLSVFPAADFPMTAQNNAGAILVIINMGETGLDDITDIRIEAKSGEFLPLVIKQIKSII